MRLIKLFIENLNIIEIIDNVKLEDKKNNLTLTSSKIIYRKIKIYLN